MVHSFRRILAAFAVLILSTVVLTGSLAQSSGQRFFPDTGHWVSGEILNAYESIPNNTLVYGYPITEAFKRATASGEAEVTYQYFERARFEFRPNQPSDLQVTLSPLGIFLYDLNQAGSVVAVAPGLSACRYFSETGFPVCYTFLEFFDQNGGIAQFGYPISEIEIHEGWMVQYFQRARFEWHPEFPPGQRVALTNVGQIFFNLTEDPKLSLPPRDDYREQIVLGLNVQVFVEKAVLSPEELQTLYVIVQDQNSIPLSNAQIVFTLSFPNGDQQNIMPLTDKNGIAKLKFPITGQIYGLYEVKVTVNYNGYQKETVTSYRVWW